MLPLIASQLPPNPTLQQVLAVHEQTFAALWFQLAPLMGNGGAQTVFARAIRLAARHAPLAEELHCGATALDFAPLRAVAEGHWRDVRAAGDTRGGVAGSQADDMVRALCALASSVEELIGNLLGPGLSQSLLRDVQLALAQER